MPTRALLVLALLAAAGCHVPVSTAAPARPSTAGAGSWRFAGHLEYSVVDVLGTAASEPSAASPNRYPTADWPVFDLELAYGVAEQLDVEVGLQGGLYAVLPIPHVAFAGVRHHAVAAEGYDLGWFARAGYGGFFASSDEEPYDGSRVGVALAAAGAAWRMHARAIEPGLAVMVQPMWIVPDVRGAEADDFFALATTTTFSVSYRAVTPFVSAGLISSQNVRGTGPTISAGLALEL